MNDALVLLLSIIGATGAAVVTGIFTRPKISAEARSSDTGSAVSVSTDAREWAKQFQRQAEGATARAEASEERARDALDRAEHAEEKADACQERCDAIEIKMDLLTDYTLTLQRLVRDSGQQVPEPPRALRPPL